jgi:hypothetical protein
MADYIVQIIPFESIDSKYAGCTYSWICPNCGIKHHHPPAIKQLKRIWCRYCNEFFKFFIAEKKGK